MKKNQIRKTVMRELMHTDWWVSHPIQIKELEDSLVEALHQALIMPSVSKRHSKCQHLNVTNRICNKCKQVITYVPDVC